MDTKSGVEFFMACISRLSVSSTDYIDCVLDAVSQAAAVKQSTDDTAQQVPGVEPLAIEGWPFTYREEIFQSFKALAVEY